MSHLLRVVILGRASRMAIVAALCLSACPHAVLAQSNTKSAESASPAPLVPAPPASPTVQPDGTATFRLALPNAVKVELHLEGTPRPLPMLKGTDGVWSVTTPRLTPQYYSYSFNVDGTAVDDPHNVTLKTSFFSVQNVFLVPGHPAMDWQSSNVPHGVVHHHGYHSNVVGIDSEYYVYTPPGFDPTSGRKYPVLYLLHGYSDDPSAWTAMGKAHVILDNLIAQGKARPMIVVMPLGYGTMEMITRGWSAWRDPELVTRNFNKFSTALFDEVMPLVKHEYPLSDKREEHAVAGLSMGGAESLLVGLNHTDYFAYVGSFSAGGLEENNLSPAFPAVTTQSAALVSANLRLLWIACGTEDGLFGLNQKLIAWLKQQGVQPTVIQTPGAHWWMLWRENLDKFVPLLFAQK